MVVMHSHTASCLHLVVSSHFHLPLACAQQNLPKQTVCEVPLRLVSWLEKHVAKLDAAREAM
jgi:hypothetical protein